MTLKNHYAARKREIGLHSIELRQISLINSIINFNPCLN